jgi:hypothetical protein
VKDSLGGPLVVDWVVQGSVLGKTVTRDLFVEELLFSLGE